MSAHSTWCSRGHRGVGPAADREKQAAPSGLNELEKQEAQQKCTKSATTLVSAIYVQQHVLSVQHIHVREDHLLVERKLRK